MANLYAPSPSAGELANIPCVIHHRDGGYLCMEPKPKAGEAGSAAIAFDRDIIPYKKYILQPKYYTSATSSGSESEAGRHLVRSKQDFYNVLDELIGKEVAIKDVESQKYLTSGQGVVGKPSAKFKENAQFFLVGRTDTGAYTFRTRDVKKQLYLHMSSKTKSWDMRSSKGRIVSIKTSQVNFGAEESNANDWIIEPDDGIIILDSMPRGEKRICHDSILFLGVVDRHSPETNLEVSYHFRNGPPAWRTKEQWNGAIRAIKSKRSDGDEYCLHTDYVGSKKKWIAKWTPVGLCVVIASSGFHQEHLEKCVDKMGAMLELGEPTAKDLSELGWNIQIEEVKSAEEDHKKLLKSERDLRKTDGAASTLECINDVPISILHRSGGWFSLDILESGPDMLHLEPIINDEQEETSSTSQTSMRTTEDYFGQLNKYPKCSIRNSEGHYLFSRERKNVFGKEKKNLIRTKYLVGEYAELKASEETPEIFVFGQNANTGGISIMSARNNCFLSRNKRGGFVFMAREEHMLSRNAEGVVCSAHEEDTWFIDAADLQSGTSSDGLIFSCIVSKQDARTIVSRHSLGRPTAWRTTESWDCMTGVLLENMGQESSTVVIDSDTGHQWFATTSNGMVFISIGTEGFPLYYGTKSVVAMEELYQTKANEATGPPSSIDLYRVMRGIETEYRYELCFGSDEVLNLIQEVEDLTDKMRANIDGLTENIATEEEILEKANQLHELAQQFKKKANKKKYSVAAAAVAGGCVAGGILGWLVGGPAGVIAFETQMAEIALGATLGGAPGIMKGIVLLSTDKFWKRQFANFGRCIDSRRQERARGKRVADLQQNSTW